MGCGSTNSSFDGKDPKKPVKDSSSSSKSTSSLHNYCIKEPPHKSQAKEHSKAPKGTSEIEINPGQFVIENRESIYKTYSIQDKIGEGAFGVVYKAVHNASKDVRAVKMIEKQYVTAEKHSKLLQEIAILKQLDHPNIVKLYEFFSDSKYYYLVTEFVDGGELFDELQRRKMFSEQTAADIMRQLLSAVVYCHERKLVHRDLKPENILIERSSKRDQISIKVIDFGTAEAFIPHSKLRQTMGTPYYIAPEVLFKSYNEKCDVWSCGVILYILLSGCPPFNGRTDEDIMRAVKRTKFNYHHTIWQDVTADAKDLINNMLKFPPETRFTAQQAYCHRWIQNKSTNSLRPSTVQALLINLRNFHAEQKLQQAALMYIVTQLTGKKEKAELQQVFMAMDKNADGKLSREELIDGYTSLYNSPEKAAKEVDLIMKNVDADHNGYIDYSEFLIASMNKERLLSKGNLKRAFDLFDRDGSGLISAEEIKTILGIGKRFSEKVWQDLIGEVDQNSDGQISFEEFEKMMVKFLQ